MPRGCSLEPSAVQRPQVVVVTQEKEAAKQRSAQVCSRAGAFKAG